MLLRPGHVGRRPGQSRRARRGRAQRTCRVSAYRAPAGLGVHNGNVRARGGQRIRRDTEVLAEHRVSDRRQDLRRGHPQPRLDVRSPGAEGAVKALQESLEGEPNIDACRPRHPEPNGQAADVFHDPETIQDHDCVALQGARPVHLLPSL